MSSVEEPKFRCGTKEAIALLARELKLPYENYMQDWAYAVASPDDIEKYVDHYEVISNEDEKFVLMQIIVQAINDQGTEANFLKYWERIKAPLKEDFRIHEYTVFYWSRFGSESIDEEFVISKSMREIWHFNRRA